MTIQLAWRSSVQLPRSTMIAGRATAVIISSSPARKTPGAEDGEQDERDPAVHARSVGEARRTPRAAGRILVPYAPGETMSGDGLEIERKYLLTARRRRPSSRPSARGRPGIEQVYLRSSDGWVRRVRRIAGRRASSATCSPASATVGDRPRGDRGRPRAEEYAPPVGRGRPGPPRDPQGAPRDPGRPLDAGARRLRRAAGPRPARGGARGRRGGPGPPAGDRRPRRPRGEHRARLHQPPGWRLAARSRPTSPTDRRHAPPMAPDRPRDDDAADDLPPPRPPAPGAATTTRGRGPRRDADRPGQAVQAGPRRPGAARSPGDPARTTSSRPATRRDPAAEATEGRPVKGAVGDPRGHADLAQAGMGSSPAHLTGPAGVPTINVALYKRALLRHRPAGVPRRARGQPPIGARPPEPLARPLPLHDRRRSSTSRTTSARSGSSTRPWPT